MTESDLKDIIFELVVHMEYLVTGNYESKAIRVKAYSPARVEELRKYLIHFMQLKDEAYDANELYSYTLIFTWE